MDQDRHHRVWSQGVSVKVYSFTVGRDGGWTAVTPLGLVQGERGQQVTIAISESWEEGADAIRRLRENKEPEADKR
jgi:hypothetical protein